MARSNPELWRRLAAFEVSPPDHAFSFMRRLAREHGWSPELARCAFEEYKRFLYLLVVVGRRLSAAEPVERVWRLHLAYPASYAQALCRDILGGRLRYEPPDEALREAGYRAALAAYEQEFGRAPPAEIWPASDRPSSPTKGRRRQLRRADRESAKLAALPLMPAARRA